jgi:N-sulfoglucosamine sulfohydrolase
VTIAVRKITSFNRVPNGPRESSTTRTRGLRGVGRIAVAVVVLCCGLCGTPSAFAAARPNILLIVSEDNGPELGCYGDPFVQTPVLDKLAADGVRFHNAYVPQAGCSQSRAALLTGLYPHQNGQIGLATWKFRMYRRDTPNLISSLKQAGYRTGIIGKLHVNPASAFPFDVHDIPKANFSRKKLGDYSKHAEEFMTDGDESFFLSVNYPDAHRPFTTQVRGLPAKPLTGADVKPLEYFGLDTPQLRQDTADYYNCMSRLDSLIGDLLSALQRTGKADNTLVIYMGDHGADLLRGKRTSYEGGIRIPLIIRWPANTASNTVCQELVSTLDLMPTLLTVAAADPVVDLPGRSLLPLLQTESPDGKGPDWRQFLFTEYHLHSAHNFYPQRTVRDGRYKLIQNLMPGQNNPGYGFTLNRFFADLPDTIEAAPDHIRRSYHRIQTPPAFELYDLHSDPYEFRNLAANADYSDVLQNLKEQLAAWRRRTKDPLLVSDNLLSLKAEIDACLEDGGASKSRLTLTYPDYFFTRD